MSANLEAKKLIVDEIKTQFDNAVSVVFADYNGVTVEEDTKLRKQARETGVVYKVYKNRLMLRALNELGIEGVNPTDLEGTTSVAIAKDEVTAAKLLGNANKDFNKLNIKFGILNKQVISKAECEKLSKIPERKVLLAMLLGGLTGTISSFARALNAVAEKKA